MNHTKIHSRQGKKLTPHVQRLIRKLYMQSGNYSEVARQVGLCESTVRKTLQRNKAPSQRKVRKRVKEHKQWLVQYRQIIKDRRALDEQFELTRALSGALHPYNAKGVRLYLRQLARATDLLLKQERREPLRQLRRELGALGYAIRQRNAHRRHAQKTAATPR